MRTLTHSPADVVRWLLVRLALGTDYRNASTWPVYAAAEPPAPDNVITVYDTAGTDDGSEMIGGELQGHYGFQVRVRALDHPTGWNKINTIRATLAEGVPASGQVGTLVVIDNPSTLPTCHYRVENIARISEVNVLGMNVANEKTRLFTLNGVVNVDQTV